MKNWRFILICAVLLVAQVVLDNFFPLRRYVLISILPAIVLLMSLDIRPVMAMLLAFALGFVVDFFSTGMLGLSSLALVPAGLARGAVVGLVFGDELTARGDELSLQRLGIPKMALAAILLCSLYFVVYIWADSAGTVPFWPAALRFALSVAVSTPLCLFAARMLRP